jgi:hypothetical protein
MSGGKIIVELSSYVLWGNGVKEMRSIVVFKYTLLQKSVEKFDNFNLNFRRKYICVCVNFPQICTRLVMLLYIVFLYHGN